MAILINEKNIDVDEFSKNGLVYVKGLVVE